MVVYLCDLAKLSPEHQSIWMANIIEEKCYMVKDFYRVTILGEFPEDHTIYEALIEEQAVINEMTKIMGKPNFFSKIFTDDRPKEFSFVLRPTKRNYLNFVHLLDKMLSENINKEFFREYILIKETIKPELKDMGTLNLLESWLRDKIRVEDEDVFNEIIEPLKKVRKIRQKQAHSIIKDDYDPKYLKSQDILMIEVYNSIRLIRLLFTNHPKLKNFEVPDWLYKGSFINY